MPTLPPPTASPTSEPTPRSTSTTATTAVEATPTDAVSGATPPASEQTTPVDPARLRAVVEDIEQKTAELRGLEPKSEVPDEFINSERMGASLKQQIDEEYSREEGRQDALTMWLLRLIDDRDLDLYQLQIDLLSEQVAGYYDPEKDELFVRNEGGELSAQARITLAHEFVHALQDQYYDLEKVRPDDLEGDRGTAILALVEGDATASQLVYAMQHMSQEDLNEIIAGSGSSQDVLDNAPRYIRESLLFPYERGLEFVTAIAGQESFGGVDKAFTDLPQSTEQILHPEKYLATPRDEPLEVTLQPLTGTLGAGWTLKDNDTLGEFDLSIMLEENGVDSPDGFVGWGGTRYNLYTKGDDAVLIMGTRWDTPGDADEFVDAMQESFSLLDAQGSLWGDRQRVMGLKRSGDQIVYVAGTDAVVVEQVMSALNP
jgi:hypothetical protein